MDESEITQIRVTKETRERLREYGIKGEAWDKIVSGLLDEIEELRGDD